MEEVKEQVIGSGKQFLVTSCALGVLSTAILGLKMVKGAVVLIL